MKILRKLKMKQKKIKTGSLERLEKLERDWDKVYRDLISNRFKNDIN